MTRPALLLLPPLLLTTLGAGGADVPLRSPADADLESMDQRSGPSEALLIQPPNGTCAQNSDVESGFTHAEPFVLDQVLTDPIDRVDFTGAYLFGNNVPPLGSDRFSVLLHEDDDGLPGPVVCTNTGLVPIARIDTGRNLGSFDLFEFRVILETPCLPAPGIYWLEIFEETFIEDEFAWECGDLDPVNGVPGSAAAAEVPGINWFGEDLDHSLTILTSGEIFSDGFESGDTSAWSTTVP